MKNKLSGDVLAVLRRMIESYLRAINMPDEDIFKFTDQFKEGNMARFFENFEPFDIQEYGRRNREEGETIFIIKQVYSKIRKNKPVEQIADELEESDNISGISEIVGLIREVSPDLDMDEDELAQAVLEKLNNKSQK